MKNILVINGHPNKESFLSQAAQAYADGARQQGAEVEVLHLSDLNFDPILHKGYLNIQELEPDLVRAQKMILNAQHIVVVFPIWWSSVPALLKGFFDRILLPGFAFKYRPNSPFWERLLKGRTGEIIISTDAPNWWNRFILGNPSINMVKKGVLDFCGVKVLKVTSFDEIKNRNERQISSFIEKARHLGRARAR